MKYVFLLFSVCLFASCADSEKKQSVILEPKQAMISSPHYEAISLLGDTLHSSTPAPKLVARYEEKLHAFEKDPENVENWIWYGRFKAYLGKYNEAVDIYSKAIEKFPNDARLYRHRGHRYITLRKFNKAIADLSKAAQLIEGKENQVEPDGMPNAMNVPVSTLHGNIYYHLGLAHYLNRDMEAALAAYKKCLATSNIPDNVVSATHWIYMILRRLGREEEAKSYLKPITSEMEVIENSAYHKACLFYKGELQLSDINTEQEEDSSSNAALNYAIGNWLYYTGETTRAKVIFEDMVAKDDWAAFGHIAAESDLKHNF
jgi:tetratricopeptide (TPR) repeat protein